MLVAPGPLGLPDLGLEGFLAFCGFGYGAEDHGSNS